MKNLLKNGFTFLQSKKAKSMLKLNNIGFTLIEVLVAMFIIGVIGVVLADLLTKTFKNSADIQLTSNLKQNGQTALNITDQTIRNSDSIVCIGAYPDASSANKTILVKKDNNFKRFIMVIPVGESNGYLTQDSPVIADPTDQALLIAACNPSTVGGTPLTNTDPVRGVSLQSGSFLSQGKNAVTIQFTLGPAIDSGISNIGKSSRVDFQTTVQLR